MFRRIRHVVFLATSVCVFAQQLTNTGTPIKVEFSCDAEDLSAVGMSCSDDNPCPIYLELSGVSSLGAKLALAGNLHGSSSTLYSLLLLSDDAGTNWREPAARVAGAALDQVQILDPNHAWAAGEMQVPLSRDPFFLIASDGGAWHKTAVSDEALVGSVERFWFDSPEHGELIIDRGHNHLLYESKAGGESWNIVSETAQTPRLRRTPAGDESGYRIGNDAKSGAFVLEKRSGEKWNKVASFLIQVANCGTRHLPPPPAEPGDGR